MTLERSNPIVATVVYALQVNLERNRRILGASAHKTDAELLIRPISYV